MSLFLFSLLIKPAIADGFCWGDCPEPEPPKPFLCIGDCEESPPKEQEVTNVDSNVKCLHKEVTVTIAANRDAATITCGATSVTYQADDGKEHAITWER